MPMPSIGEMTPPRTWAVDSGSQLLDLFRGLFEEVKSEAQRRPFAYAGKVGEVLDGVGEGV